MKQLRALTHETKIIGITVGLAVVLAGASFQGGRLSHAQTFTRHIVRKESVAEQYGKPAKTVPGTDVNPQLTGFSCDIYQTPATIICHR